MIFWRLCENTWLSLTGALNKVGGQVRLSLCHGIIGKKSGSHWAGGSKKTLARKRELWMLVILMALPQAHRCLTSGIRCSHQLGHWFSGRNSKGIQVTTGNADSQTWLITQIIWERCSKSRLSGPTLWFCYSQSRTGAEKPHFQWLLHKCKAAFGTLSGCAQSVNTYLCVP